MDTTFFATPDEFRAWLARHHEDARELWIGFWKKSSGKPSITWAEAVDQALCFGWIDGLRRSVDESSYTIRFTPRSARSTWSAVNVARAAELARDGLMASAGLEAFERRTAAKSGIYSYEQRHAAELDPAHERRFRANARAWEFFQSRPAGYRRTATWWVVSAKREETRLRRLAALIEASEQGLPVPPLARRKEQS